MRNDFGNRPYRKQSFKKGGSVKKAVYKHGIEKNQLKRKIRKNNY